jgi:hypothetical protein
MPDIYAVTAATAQSGYGALVVGYRLRDGSTSVCRVGNDGKLTYGYKFPWQGGLTNIVGYSLQGQAFVFGFRNSDRQAFILAADPEGNLSQKFQGQLDTPWTDFAIAPISPVVGPGAFMWASHLGSGNARIYAISANGNSLDPLSTATFLPQFSMCLGFSTFEQPFNVNPFALAYNWQSNMVYFNQLFGTGYQNTYQASWRAGTSGIAAVSDATAGTYIWSYRASDGACAIQKVGWTGDGFSSTWTGSFAQGYNNFAGFAVNGNAYVAAYRASDGTISILQINADGRGFQIVYTGTISSGS